ncbi:hypothetical protein DFH09DRAFT_1431530 [Mycena vulgaris]|nr:hypothetical protein DFH09DRAFT_1431530 [Mycena vulgaris]
MAHTPCDLKKVGRLFDETLAAIRDSTDTEALEPLAIAWLKDARYKCMRQVEASYYELARSRDTPLSLPTWVDPSQFLFLETGAIPTILLPYFTLFSENLVKLMKSCGFHTCDSIQTGSGILLTIKFPTRPRVAPGSTSTLPKILDVEDEFSGMEEGVAQEDHKQGVGRFGATDFGRLLMDARSESGNDQTSSPRRAPDQAFLEPKERVGAILPRVVFSEHYQWAEICMKMIEGVDGMGWYNNMWPLTNSWAIGRTTLYNCEKFVPRGRRMTGVVRNPRLRREENGPRCATPALLTKKLAAPVGVPYPMAMNPAYGLIIDEESQHLRRTLVDCVADNPGYITSKYRYLHLVQPGVTKLDNG